MPVRPTLSAPKTPAAKPMSNGKSSCSSAKTPRGPHYERWRHIHGCGRFFNALRDTVSDRFYTTYKAGEPRPDLSDFLGDDA